MIITTDVKENAKKYYDLLVLYFSDTDTRNMQKEVNEAIYAIKQVAHINTVPNSIGPIGTVNIVNSRVICIGDDIARNYQAKMCASPTDIVPLFVKGMAQVNEYYVLDGGAVQSTLARVVRELYRMSVQIEPALELEYMMMNRTPEDLGELYV